MISSGWLYFQFLVFTLFQALFLTGGDTDGFKHSNVCEAWLTCKTMQESIRGIVAKSKNVGHQLIDVEVIRERIHLYMEWNWIWFVFAEYLLTLKFFFLANKLDRNWLNHVTFFQICEDVKMAAPMRDEVRFKIQYVLISRVAFPLKWAMGLFL